MTGILVQLILSWLLLWRIEKSNLSVLGLYPTRQRLFYFSFFFLLAAACSVSGFGLRMWLAGHRWQLNPSLNIGETLLAVWWNIKSVMFEELLFRGALLYLLIKKMGAGIAIIVSAIAFGIYHWFSQEILGNPMQMLYTFAITGTMGLLLAYGFVKKFSLFIPLGIHLGWNLSQSVVFSESVLGNQLLVPVKNIPPVELTYFFYYCILFLPLTAVLVIPFFILKKMKPAESPKK